MNRLARSLALCSVIGLFAITAGAQDQQGATSTPAPADTPNDQPSDLKFSFQGDAAIVSKYIWRGQRLTNDWSLQPSVTLGAGDFSLNVWGTMDLTAVNEGTQLLLPENPAAPVGGDASGLQGRFSEVDYTFSYARTIGKAGLSGGAIVYTFPDRGATLRSTTELYGGLSLDSLPLAPSATLYVDVDETSESGDTGLYLKLAAGRSIALRNNRFPTLDITGSLGVANGGCGKYYYGADHAGLHDVNITFTAPIKLTERFSASAYLAYSALLGDFRDLQYPDLREVYRGRLGPGKADTVWGGATLSVAF